MKLHLQISAKFSMTSKMKAIEIFKSVIKDHQALPLDASSYKKSPKLNEMSSQMEL
ncbi:hypothetical protein YC2023_002503 [Brassica napus]